MDWNTIQLVQISKELKRIAVALEGINNALQED